MHAMILGSWLDIVTSIVCELHADDPFTDYTEGAELVDSVLDVVRKEAEGTDALQGTCFLPWRLSCVT